MIVNYVEAWTLKANVQMTVIQHCRIRSHCSPKKGPFASSFYLSYKCDYLKDSLLVDTITFQKEKDNSLVKYTLDTRLLNYCGNFRKKCRPGPFWGPRPKATGSNFSVGQGYFREPLCPKKGISCARQKGYAGASAFSIVLLSPFDLSGPQRELVSKQNG